MDEYKILDATRPVFRVGAFAHFLVWSHDCISDIGAQEAGGCAGTPPRDPQECSSSTPITDLLWLLADGCGCVQLPWDLASCF